MPPTQSEQETFTGLVRIALQNIDNPVALQTSPLAAELVHDADDQPDAGARLRAVLMESIKALKPKQELPIHDPQCRGYHLLRLRYVEHKSRYRVCEELAIGQSSYYRCRRQALDTLTTLLWQHLQSPEKKPLVEPEMAASAGNAMQEALRLAKTGRKQAVDLAEAFQSAIDTVQPLLDQEQATLEFLAGDTALIAYADPGILRQVALDILINGMDMMNRGQVRLAVEARGDRAFWGLYCETTRREVDPQVDPERFAFGRELLRVYGGDLTLFQDDQVLGVHFEIPLVRPHTILVIDDSADAIRLYSRWLRANGYMVRTASNEDDVRNQLARQAPDLILLDVLMPHWDGWMALQDLKAGEQTKHIPVIIASVLSRPRLALALGASAVLTKPVDEDDLLSAIREALSAADSAAACAPGNTE